MAVILVVDDDEKILNFLKVLLEKEGHDVRLASNGEDCFESITQKGVPNLIILDVMMPGMDGYSVARIIRKKISAMVPILFLTARNTSSDMVTSFDVGGSEFIGKPFDSNKLLKVIKRLLTQPFKKRIEKY